MHTSTHPFAYTSVYMNVLRSKQGVSDVFGALWNNKGAAAVKTQRLLAAAWKIGDKVKRKIDSWDFSDGTPTLHANECDLFAFFHLHLLYFVKDIYTFLH